MDTRCGMNTQSHYAAKAVSNLNKMNLSWKAYDVMTGNVADSNSFGYTNRSNIQDSSKKNLAIERSQAKYQFEKGGSFWNPTSNVYHCTVLSSKFEMDGDKEDDVLNDLRSLYDQQKQTKNINSQNEEKVVNNIVNELFEEEYKETLNEYTFESGEKMGLEDFEIQKVSAENKNKLNADGVQINNQEKINSIIIELEMSDIVYKDGDEYQLTGYVIFKDDKDERIDYGINGDLMND